MQSEFHRIRRLPPYVFEEVNRLKAEARGRGEDIIDFGMGNPDMPTPKHIVQKLIETARDQVQEDDLAALNELRRALDAGELGAEGFQTALRLGGGSAAEVKRILFRPPPRDDD